MCCEGRHIIKTFLRACTSSHKLDLLLLGDVLSLVHLVINVYHGDFQLGLVCGLLYFKPNPFVPHLLFCLPNNLHLMLQSFAIVHPTRFSVL